MKVYQINSFGNLSTGTIAKGIYKALLNDGHECRIAFGRGTIEPDVSSYRIGNKLSVYADGILTRLTDKAGFYSRLATKKLIEDIEEFNPDVIQLHNLHGYYLNVEILFNYLKKKNIPVVWTLHDCWAFTGHCCYYSKLDCQKWKNQCKNCPQIKRYPKACRDNSENNYINKKQIFTRLKNLSIVTVSKWLEHEVEKSFLNMYPIQTIYNGIDLELFKPCKKNIELEEKYNLKNKKVILGVASTWSENKGLNSFVKLSSILPKNYRIVLIGLSKKQIKLIPKNIIGLERTTTVEELVDWYNIAYIFFNASIEETFGLPTIEAIACGTPSIVYDCTALPEIILKESGFIVPKENVQGVLEKILNSENESFNSQDLVKSVEKYSEENIYKSYISLYESSLNSMEKEICKK